MLPEEGMISFMAKGFPGFDDTQGRVPTPSIMLALAEDQLTVVGLTLLVLKGTVRTSRYNRPLPG